MARPDIAEARKLTDGEINDQIDGIRRELFTLRFEQATRRLENPTVSKLPASGWPN